MEYLRTEIKNYFQMRDRIETIVKEVLRENVSLEDVRRNYSAHYGADTMRRIERTVQVVQMKQIYFKKKDRYLAAVKDYIAGVLTTDIFMKYNITASTFYKKLSLYKKHGDICNWKISKDRFTYEQEEILLRPLRHWLKTPFDKTNLNLFDKFCTCRICGLEALSKVALRFARENEITCCSHWDSLGRADIIWLTEFDMRHDISQFCFSRYCHRDKRWY